MTERYVVYVTLSSRVVKKNKHFDLVALKKELSFSVPFRKRSEALQLAKAISYMGAVEVLDLEDPHRDEDYPVIYSNC